MDGTRRAGVWIAVLLGVLAWTPDAPHGGALAAEHGAAAHATPCGVMHGAEDGAHGDGCAHTGAAECDCAATCCAAAAVDAAPGAAHDGAARTAAPRGGLAGDQAAEPPLRPPIRAI